MMSSVVSTRIAFLLLVCLWFTVGIGRAIEAMAVNIEHIGARIRATSSTGPISYRPVFCSETCWAALVMATEEPAQVIELS